MEIMPFANIAFFGGRYPLVPGAPGLQKKIMWLAKCFYHPTGDIYHIMNWKKRRSYYFFESTAGVKEVVIYGQIRFSPDWTAPHVCYFLGSYPLYWDRKMNRITFAHQMPKGEKWVFGKKPSHPDAWGWTPTKENAIQYAKDFPGSIYGAIVQQYNLIEAWDKRIKTCIYGNYTAPKYKRSRIINDKEWPGVEWPWMKQPEQTTLPTPKPQKPTKWRIWLTLTMEFTDPNNRDGLKLTVDYF